MPNLRFCGPEVRAADARAGVADVAVGEEHGRARVRQFGRAHPSGTACRVAAADQKSRCLTVAPTRAAVATCPYGPVRRCVSPPTVTPVTHRFAYVVSAVCWVPISTSG